MFPSILFEDRDLTVLEKGPDMVVNRSGTSSDNTLQDWVEENLEFGVEDMGFKDSNVEQGDFVKRSGIVHRLDRETSGIILVAKNERTFLALQSQFKERSVRKEYVVLVHGHIKGDTGVIDVPVGRLPWARTKFGVHSGGRAALTEYKVERRAELPSERDTIPVSLVRVYPATGRTHQIRVHFQHIHHPVFADSLYAGRKTGRGDRALLPRQFLHAAAIEFVHPTTNEKLRFESPLPSDLVAITLSFA